MSFRVVKIVALITLKDMDLNTAVQYYFLCKIVYSPMKIIYLGIHLTGRSETYLHCFKHTYGNDL